MLVRTGPIWCGILVLGLFVSRAPAQTPNVEPEVFRSSEAAKQAVPRLIDNLKSTDEKVRNKAIATLGSIGPDAKKAAPALVEVAVNSRGHALALRALAKIDDESTRQALRQLLIGGRGRCKCGNTFVDVIASAGETMVPHLIVLLSDDNIGRNSEVAIAQIGEPAVPALFRVLEVQPALRLAAARTIALMGPKGKAATPALEKQMADATGSLKLNIALALHTANGTHPAAFEVLHAALKSDDKALRLESLNAFTRLGTKAKALVPDVIKLLTGDDGQCQYPAMLVLMSIGEGAVPALVDALAKGETKTDLVAQTLRAIGPAASPAIPDFIRMLEGRDDARAVFAAESFPAFGPEGKKAIPQLITALKADQLKLRYAAAQSLVSLDRNHAPQTIDALVSVFGSPNAWERQAALRLLGSFGAQGKSAIPSLLDGLKNANLDNRLWIADAIIRIDPDQANAVLPTLQEAIQLKKGTPNFRQQVNAAMRMLTQLGPKAKGMSPAMQQLLKMSLKDIESYIDSNTVANCLIKMGDSDKVMPIVIEALNSKEPGERMESRFLVEDLLGVSALPALEAAVANGQLRGSPEANSLLARLRKQAKVNGTN